MLWIDKTPNSVQSLMCLFKCLWFTKQWITFWHIYIHSCIINFLWNTKQRTCESAFKRFNQLHCSGPYVDSGVLILYTHSPHCCVWKILIRRWQFVRKGSTALLTYQTHSNILPPIWPPIHKHTHECAQNKIMTGFNNDSKWSKVNVSELS